MFSNKNCQYNDKLNYYARNSPKKQKNNHQPGFLLNTKSLQKKQSQKRRNNSNIEKDKSNGSQTINYIYISDQQSFENQINQFSSQDQFFPYIYKLDNLKFSHQASDQKKRDTRLNFSQYTKKLMSSQNNNVKYKANLKDQAQKRQKLQNKDNINKQLTRQFSFGNPNTPLYQERQQQQINSNIRNSHNRQKKITKARFREDQSYNYTLVSQSEKKQRQWKKFLINLTHQINKPKQFDQNKKQQYKISLKNNKKLNEQDNYIWIKPQQYHNCQLNKIQKIDQRSPYQINEDLDNESLKIEDSLEKFQKQQIKFVQINQIKEVDQPQILNFQEKKQIKPINQQFEKIQNLDYFEDINLNNQEQRYQSEENVSQKIQLNLNQDTNQENIEQISQDNTKTLQYSQKRSGLTNSRKKKTQFSSLKSSRRKQQLQLTITSQTNLLEQILIKRQIQEQKLKIKKVQNINRFIPFPNIPIEKINIESSNLIMQTISDLPSNIIPVYLKIHEKLAAMQRKSNLQLAQQRNLMLIIQYLLLLRRQKMQGENYALSQPTSKVQSQILQNQIIIRSLIRKLAICI